MVINPSKKPALIFDLDDTLYSEYDFVISGFKSISKLYKGKESEVLIELIAEHKVGGNPFNLLMKNYPGTFKNLEEIINHYRCHLPQIKLYPDSDKFLTAVKGKGLKTGLITDGRSISQRNKIKALGLSNYFDKIIISEEFGSEKPSERNYSVFCELAKDGEFIFFGDNPVKDFIVPNRLGWLTIGLSDRDNNIHKQDMSLSLECQPRFWISSYDEISFV